MKNLLIVLLVACLLCPFASQFYITQATVCGIWAERDVMACMYEFPNGEGYVADWPENGPELDAKVLVLVGKNGPDIYDDRLVAVASCDGIFTYANIVQ